MRDCPEDLFRLSKNIPTRPQSQLLCCCFSGYDLAAPANRISNRMPSTPVTYKICKSRVETLCGLCVLNLCGLCVKKAFNRKERKEVRRKARKEKAVDLFILLIRIK
jgi:hypothetical protein